MPIYVYRCDNCDIDVEKRQGFTDAPLATCETCSGSVRRVLQPVGVIFKGSGFYVTDTRAEKEAKSGAKNGSTQEGAAKPASGESGGDAGKAESKSETKTESTPAATAPSSDKK